MSLAVQTDTTYPAPVNKFGYIVGRPAPAFVDSTVAVPGQPLPVTEVQPAVPVTRGQKTVAYNEREQAMAAMAATQPPPPRRAPIIWRQTRLSAPAELEVSRSRTDLLSSQLARQGG